MVALAPFLARLPIGADVSFYVGDSFAGEITFHLGAVGSAAADEDGDGWIGGSAGGGCGGCGAAKKNSGEQDEGKRRYPGDLSARWGSEGGHRVFSHIPCSNGPILPAGCETSNRQK